MGLKEGTLESLIQSNPTLDSPRLPYTILHEMLQALDYLAVKKIVHRDIKPANILYLSLPDRVASKETPYLFQLGDFGLSDRLDVAKTRAGTKFFMAPEVFKEEQQTLAADIWSLFVTMLWVVDKEFRQYSESEHHHGEIWDTVTRAASGQYKNIGRMGEFAPSERATAAQMLVEHFNGEGLTTPRMQIPPFMDRKKT